MSLHEWRECLCFIVLLFRLLFISDFVAASFSASVTVPVICLRVYVSFLYVSCSSVSS